MCDIWFNYGTFNTMFTDMIKWKTSIVLNFNSQEIFHLIFFTGDIFINHHSVCVNLPPCWYYDVAFMTALYTLRNIPIDNQGTFTGLNTHFDRRF